MPLYYCDRCGTYRNDDEQCRVCGGNRFEQYEEEGEYVCEVCGDSFDTQRGLTTHKRVHEDED